MASPPPSLPPLDILAAAWPEYALLDSGRRRKLERFGSQLIIRGEPKAWWEPALPDAAWARAHAVHDEDRPWRFTSGAPREWLMRWRSLTLQAKITDTSKHLGIFPEQAPHWEFIQAHCPSATTSTLQQFNASTVQRPPAPLRFLNLFGYTGVASLAAAAAGYTVTHVDASKPAIAWGRQNQELSGLAAAPIRWILDDALKFLRREIRRGVRYDAIALDPPSYGRGPSGELWKVETQLPELLALCRQCLAEQPRFILLTMYNLEASSLMLANILDQTLHGLPGGITRGELALLPNPGQLSGNSPESVANSKLETRNPQLPSASPRPLPLSLWARWEAK